MKQKSKPLVIVLATTLVSISYASDNSVNFTHPKKAKETINQISPQQLTVDKLLGGTEKEDYSIDTDIDILNHPLIPEQSAIVVSTGPNDKAIANLINSHITTIYWQGINNRLRSPELVATLYRQMGFQSLWSNNGKVSPLAEQMIQSINESKYHALNPIAYHQNALAVFKLGQTISEPEKFDILLTDAFITYKSHLENGILSPKSQFPSWNTPKQEVNYLNLYQKANFDNNLTEVLNVRDNDYHILQQAYKEGLENKEKESGFPKVPYLRGQKSGESVRILRERLGLDSSIDIYDDELKKAIKNYQSDNGLIADGIAGIGTINHMNQSAGKLDLKKLAINMERLRWSYVPRNQNYVWVNIPAYHMTIKNNNKTIFSSRAIVGRSRRPTPVFSDQLRHVVLAPYWNVPSTIFKEDKLPKLRKNPNAFGGSIEVIDTSTGKVVNPSTVNWKNGGQGYRLRQKPGARNALGRMKFLFPNKHAIYLHDTPNRSLFKRSKRALSSGCIRVQRAEDLASFLLKDMGYDHNRVKAESHRSREKWVNLNQDLRYPVFLNYYTVWVDDSGEIRNATDIYGYDKKMEKAYYNQLKNL